MQEASLPSHEIIVKNFYGEREVGDRVYELPSGFAGKKPEQPEPTIGLKLTDTSTKFKSGKKFEFKR